MRYYYCICFCLIINVAIAQSTPGEFFPEKFPAATIYLDDNSLMQGTIMKISDKVLTLSAYAADTSKTKTFFEIDIPHIRKIHIKTDVALSMAGGAVIAGLVGYGLGYITYSDKNSISEEDNKDRQKLRGAIGALITAVPGAFIGMITGLFRKQNFTINGDNERMKKLKRALR